MKLPQPRIHGGMPLVQALEARRSIRDYADEPLTLQDISQLLWSAQGVTEPETGYRTTPSAGATFPLETYLVAGAVDGLEAGVYRYDPASHAIKQTAAGDIRAELAAACMNQGCVGNCAVGILFGTVEQRTADTYGELAHDFVMMEAGHAAQNISLQAVDLGLGAVAIGAIDAGKVKAMTGMGNEAEPVYMMVMGKPAG